WTWTGSRCTSRGSASTPTCSSRPNSAPPPPAWPGAWRGWAAEYRGPGVSVIAERGSTAARFEGVRLADGSLLRAWLPAVVAMAVLGMHHLVGAALDSTGAADHSRHAAVPAAASAPADLHEVTGFAPDGHRADG